MADRARGYPPVDELPYGLRLGGGLPQPGYDEPDGMGYPEDVPMWAPPTKRLRADPYAPFEGPGLTSQRAAHRLQLPDLLAQLQQQSERNGMH
jgi:hypothetical protein